MKVISNLTTNRTSNALYMRGLIFKSDIPERLRQKQQNMQKEGSLQELLKSLYRKMPVKSTTSRHTRNLIFKSTGCMMSQHISLLYPTMLWLTVYLKPSCYFQNAEMQAFAEAAFSDYCFLNIFNKKKC